MAQPTFFQTRQWRNFDPWLLGAVLLLLALGLLIIFSASQATTSPGTPWRDYPMVRQALYMLMGLFLMVLATYLNYRILGTLAPFLYIAAAGLLVAVLFLGESNYGARRWLDLLLIPIQPSEIAKLCFIVASAKFLADRGSQVRRWWVLFASLALILPPMALIFLQPDLGTALILGAVWLGIVYMAGMPFVHLFAVGIAALALLPALASRLFQGYMWQRLLTFLDPGRDPLGAGYNVLQSEISVGSGGLFGKGFLQGTQTQLHFLRIQRTDFVFSVLGEELGFVGAMVLLGLFLLLLFRALRVAELSPDPFGRLTATGILVLILTQTVINVGGNIHLLPIAGVPLPFISYGGSSLVTFLIAIGLLQSILIRRHRPASG